MTDGQMVLAAVGATAVLFIGFGVVIHKTALASWERHCLAAWADYSPQWSWPGRCRIVIDGRLVPTSAVKFTP